ncbi:uncharacterized protein [Miscanthus floridulus]|uniref:uncharacterized protein n=1 Tax=Miscanthus floridulus TaxID=154761 RepID=UPI003458E27D
MAPRASASSPVFLGGEGEDASRPATAHPGAKADTPKAQVLGKRVVSLVGSTAEVEQAAARATQPPPPRVEGAPESSEGRPALADMGAVPPSPPPPLQRTRDTVQKRLCPHSSQKRQAEAPSLAPHKALKVSMGSTAQWVVKVQAAIQHGAVLAKADPKETVAQGEVTEVAMKQAGEEVPTPREAKALKPGEAKAPSVAEATEGGDKAPRTSEVAVAKARASRASEAEVVDAGAPRTTEAEVAEAGALTTTEAEAAEVGVGTVKPTAQDMETEEGQASVPPWSKTHHHCRGAPRRWRSI